MRKTIYAFTVFTIILIITFFWGELDNLNVNEKINDAKISNFFTSFSGVVVAISLYYLYEQIVETKLTNLPDLNISSSVFNVTEKTGIIHNKKSLKFLQVIDNRASEMSPFFELHNLGLGASKNISIKWIYDIEQIKNIIKEDYEYFPIFIAENQKIGFLASNDKVQINIPEFYFYCCAPEFNFNEKNHSELSKKMMNGENIHPKLEVEITYNNQRNAIIKRKFEVEIQAVKNTIKTFFKQT